MKIDKLFIGTIAIVTNKKFTSGWTRGIDTYSSSIKKTLLYESGKYYYDILQDTKYRKFYDICNLKIGEKFVDFRYGTISFTDFMELIKLNNPNIKIEIPKNITKKKVLELINTTTKSKEV